MSLSFKPDKSTSLTAWFDETLKPEGWFDQEYSKLAGQTFSYTASGGAVSGGAALTAKGKSYLASGGAVTGGAALVSKSKSYTANGGILSGGAAITSQMQAGPLVSLGDYSSAKIRLVSRPAHKFTYRASGGLTASGSALTQLHPMAAVPVVTQIYPFAMRGGTKSGGSATVKFNSRSAVIRRMDEDWLLMA